MSTHTIININDILLEICPICGRKETTIDREVVMIEGTHLYMVYSICHNCGARFPQGPMSTEVAEKITGPLSEANTLRGKAFEEITWAESDLQKLKYLTTDDFRKLARR